MIPSHIRSIECEAFEQTEAENERRVREFVNHSLAREILASKSLVTVDGFNGAGKSTIGKFLAAHRGAKLVGLDSFLNEDRNAYLEELRLAEVAATIDAALGAGKSVVVEGCMVDEVMLRLGRKADFRIYVMRISRSQGVEFDSIDKYDELYGEKSAEELIAEMKEQAIRRMTAPEEFGGGGDGTVPGLCIELVRYHRSARPHDAADLIIKVVRVG